MNRADGVVPEAAPRTRSRILSTVPATTIDLTQEQPLCCQLSIGEKITR